MKKENQVTKIKITNYTGFVNGDGNIIKDSVHYVVDPPHGHAANGERGYWVKNTYEIPMLILHGEYVAVENEKEQSG